MNQSVDIFITTYERQHFAKQCIQYIRERTKTPFRLFIIDNGGNEELKNEEGVFLYIGLSSNVGIHAAWNLALSLAESEFFITCDPDLLCPDLDPDWLAQLLDFIRERPDYGAISLHPHVFIGAAGIDPNDPEDVKERNMCGAVFRIMRTEAVRSAGGWEHKIEAGRNHEERTICSRLQTAGFKVGITSRLRAYHMFGDNWGYPESFTPEMQKHNPELKEYVKSFDHQDAYDNKTWMPK
jgi:glycosyltransferase involved in cell wall biosynthesis